jgi:hypothetical protein
MRITYVVTTIVVALANGYTAALNFAGAESVKVVGGPSARVDALDDSVWSRVGRG